MRLHTFIAQFNSYGSETVSTVTILTTARCRVACRCNIAISVQLLKVKQLKLFSSHNYTNLICVLYCLIVNLAISNVIKGLKTVAINQVSSNMNLVNLRVCSLR